MEVSCHENTAEQMTHLSEEREPLSCFSSCLQRSISTAFIPSTERERVREMERGEEERKKSIDKSHTISHILHNTCVYSVIDF